MAPKARVRASAASKKRFEDFCKALDEGISKEFIATGEFFSKKIYRKPYSKDELATKYIYMRVQAV